MFADQSKVYVQQQEEGRKHLWREALEASSEGDMFLLSLLEVVLEDEKEQAERAQKEAELSKMLKGEARTIPYRQTDYSDWCRSFIDNILYKACSVLLIVAAGVVGAVEVEYGSSPPPSIVVADFVLIAWFCLECNIHIGAEGEHPQCYFFGRDSEVWTVAARWNVFDFTVSYSSLVLATIITEAGEGSYRVVVLLRLLRLLRLATILNKSPELTVIVVGFVSAVNSVVYILLVLLIVFYMYAVLGFSLFAENDPVRFGSVKLAMVTLLQCATLSYWDEVFYTQRLGCDSFPGTLYSQTGFASTAAEASSPLGSRVRTWTGRIPAPVCEHPVAQPELSVLYFVSFTGLTAFIILSLFVGIITLSMLEQMETHIRSKRQTRKALEFREQLSVSLEHAIDVTEQQMMVEAACDGWVNQRTSIAPRRASSIMSPKGSGSSLAAAAAGGGGGGASGGGGGAGARARSLLRSISSSVDGGGSSVGGASMDASVDALHSTSRKAAAGGAQGSSSRRQSSWGRAGSFTFSKWSEPLTGLRAVLAGNSMDGGQGSGDAPGGGGSSSRSPSSSSCDGHRLLLDGDGLDERDPEVAEAILRLDVFKPIDFQIDFTNDHLEDEAEMERLRYDFSDDSSATTPLLEGGEGGGGSSRRGSTLSVAAQTATSKRSRRQTKNVTNLKREWRDDDLIKGVMKFLRKGQFELVAEAPMQDQAFCVTAVKFVFGKHLGKARWEEVAKAAAWVVEHPYFDSGVTLTVILATVLVVLGSLRTEKNEEAVDPGVLAALNLTVLIIFAAEAALKIVSAGLSPFAYFSDNWNVFDFTVVVLSIGFLLIGGSNVSILRTMRLLQVVKLTKKLRNLRVLIEALFTGFASVGYVMVLISMFNFILGVAGVNYFLENDGFNFGTVRVAMVTLFRVETLQAWEEVMLVTFFGCDVYMTPGTSNFHDDSCKSPEASGFLVLLYYGLVVVFGALVMPSLLVAIITASVKESNFEAKEGMELDQRVGSVVTEYESVFPPDKVLLYDTLFRFGDKDGSGALDLEEIMGVLSHVTDFGGAHFNRDLTMQVFLCVDKDDNESIDKAEYFEMVGKILKVVEVLEAKGLSFGDNSSISRSRSRARSDAVAVTSPFSPVTVAELAGFPAAPTPSGASSAAAAQAAEDSAEDEGGGDGSNSNDAVTAAAATAVAAEKAAKAATAGVQAVAPNWAGLVKLCEEVLRLNQKQWEARDRAVQALASDQDEARAAAAAANAIRHQQQQHGGDGGGGQASSSSPAAQEGTWNKGTLRRLSSLSGSVDSSTGGSMVPVPMGALPPLPPLRRDLSFFDTINAMGRACYRLCVSGILAEIRMGGALEHFEPAPTFVGPAPAYYFGTGAFGTGYYYDHIGASTLPPGAGQRQLRAIAVRKQARRFRAQALWDFLDSRWVASSSPTALSLVDVAMLAHHQGPFASRARAQVAVKVEAEKALEEERAGRVARERAARGLPPDDPSLDRRNRLFGSSGSGFPDDDEEEEDDEGGMGGGGRPHGPSSSAAAAAAARATFPTSSFSSLAAITGGNLRGWTSGLSKRRSVAVAGKGGEGGRGTGNGGRQHHQHLNNSSSRERQPPPHASVAFQATRAGGAASPDAAAGSPPAAAGAAAASSTSKPKKRATTITARAVVAAEEGSGSSGQRSMVGRSGRFRRGGPLAPAKQILSLEPSTEFQDAHQALLTSIRSARVKPLRPLAPVDSFVPASRNLAKVSTLHELLREKLAADPHMTRAKLDCFDSLLGTARRVAEGQGHWNTRHTRSSEGSDPLLHSPDAAAAAGGATTREVFFPEGKFDSEDEEEEEGATGAFGDNDDPLGRREERKKKKEEESRRQQKERDEEEAESRRWPPRLTKAWPDAGDHIAPRKLDRFEFALPSSSSSTSSSASSSSSSSSLVSSATADGGGGPSTVMMINASETVEAFALSSGMMTAVAAAATRGQRPSSLGSSSSSSAPSSSGLSALAAASSPSSFLTGPSLALSGAGGGGGGGDETSATTKVDALLGLVADAAANKTTTVKASTAASAAGLKGCGARASLTGGGGGGGDQSKEANGDDEKKGGEGEDDEEDEEEDGELDSEDEEEMNLWELSSAAITGGGGGGGCEGAAAGGAAAAMAAGAGGGAGGGGGFSFFGAAGGGGGGSVTMAALEKDSVAIERAKAFAEELKALPVPPPGTAAEAQRAVDIQRANDTVEELAEVRRKRAFQIRKRLKASRLSRKKPPFPAPPCKGWLRLVDPDKTGLGGFGPGFNGFRGMADRAEEEAQKARAEAQMKRYSLSARGSRVYSSFSSRGSDEGRTQKGSLGSSLSSGNGGGGSMSNSILELSKLGTEIEGRSIGGSEQGLEAVHRRQLRELHNAVRWGNTEDVAAIVKRRAHLLGDPDPDTGNVALHIAVQSDRFDFVEVFLRRFNVRQRKKTPEELLDEDDEDQDEEIAHDETRQIRFPGDRTELLAFVDVNAQNFKGNTALHMAVEYDLVECQRVLVEFGADLNSRNGDGFPAVRGISGTSG